MFRFALLALLMLGFGSQSLANDFRLLRLDGHLVKWGDPSWLSGARVTYSFTQTQTHFADAINCRTMVPLDGLLAKSGISDQEFERAIRRAFDRWEDAADLRFDYVEDPDAADILIGAQGQPRDIAYTNVWHAPAAQGEIAAITKATYCLNPDATWETTFDGDESTYDIERVATHEIGHAVGLDHPGPSGQLMGYRYSETVNGLGPGDVLGATRLYGSPRHETFGSLPR